ncbi:MAG TPA: YihY/virulence factor BrkB family protein [Gaiellaceae bacterium]|nr:YihY/virulence factor BrkB family protein [Gaiellaceae bacterium]
MRELTLPIERERTLEVGHDVISTLRRHRVATHATALAFRVLTSLVPLAILGICVLATVGLESVWTDSISPILHRHLASSAAAAADDAVRGIFERNGALLLVLASLMLVWNTLRATSEVEHALDEIHDRETQSRAFLETFARRLALALVVDACLLGALVSFVVAPRIVENGALHYSLDVVRWIAAVALLWVAVTVLFRYATVEPPETSWASAGSALVVAGWLVASLLFGFWSTSIANYKTGLGTLTAFLVLTAYTLVVAYVFVLGAQLDESLRRSRAKRPG